MTMKKIFSYIFTLVFSLGFISVLLAVNAIEHNTVQLSTGLIWAAISLGATGLGAWGMNKLTNEEELRKEWE
jgi:hypothetical protein